MRGWGMVDDDDTETNDEEETRDDREVDKTQRRVTKFAQMKRTKNRRKEGNRETK